VLYVVEFALKQSKQPFYNFVLKKSQVPKYVHK